MTEKFEYDNLLSGIAETERESIQAGQDLTRGTVVGKVTATGKVLAVNSTASDGSQTPYGIIADNVKSGELVTVYLTGEFNENALSFGGTDTVEKHRTNLRNIGIFLSKNIKA